MLKKADIGVGLYLLAAVVFFIVPIPSVLLDVMLAFNISIALIIVFNVLLMYLFVTVIGLNTSFLKTVSKILATGIVFFWNFFVRKLFIYKEVN